jgi:zinc transporter
VTTVEPIYGSDQGGMVWGYLFAPGRPPDLVDCDAAAGLLAGRSGPRADWFLWLHFSLANAASERWLRQNLSLPDAFHESLHESVGSTRLEQAGDSLVAVIHDVLFDFNFDASDVSTVTLSVEPHVLVSARPKPVRSIDRLRASIKAGATFRSTAALLAHLLQDQAGVLVEIVRHSTSRVDDIEDKLLGNRIPVSRSDLGSLRRVLVRLQRLLAPEPAALFRLLSRPPEWIGEDDLQDLRQSAEEFSAVVTDSAALVERIRLLQEELAAQINEQNNRILFLLTLVTVLALPVNLIAGLLGMNVGGIPLAENQRGFWVIVGVVASLTAGLSLLALHRRRRG